MKILFMWRTSSMFHSQGWRHWLLQRIYHLSLYPPFLMIYILSLGSVSCPEDLYPVLGIYILSWGSVYCPEDLILSWLSVSCPEDLYPFLRIYILSWGSVSCLEDLYPVLRILSSWGSVSCPDDQYPPEGTYISRLCLLFILATLCVLTYLWRSLIYMESFLSLIKSIIILQYMPIHHIFFNSSPTCHVN